MHLKGINIFLVNRLRIISVLALFGLIIVMLEGCRKDQVDLTSEIVSSAKVRNLQNWVKNNGQNFNNSKITISNNSSITEGYLEWSSIKKIKSKNYEFYEIPYFFEKQQEASLKTNEGLIQTYTRYKLVLQENVNDGKIVGRIIGQIDYNLEKVDYRKKSVFFLDDLNANRDAVFLKENGYLKRVFENERNNLSLKLSSTVEYNVKQKQQSCISISIPVRAWSCSGTPTNQYSYGVTCISNIVGYNSYTYCPNPSSGGSEPGDWENFNSGAYDAAGGFDPNLLTPQVVVDSSIAQNQKVNCIYEKLLTDSSAYGLISLLQAFQGESGFNIIFKLKDIDSEGKTHYSGNGVFEVWINRTSALDTEYSRIWLASTFMHEAFHAKLRQKALAVFGAQDIQNWPKNIEDMTLAELASYVEINAKSKNIWDGIMHDYMVNHINEMAILIQNFVFKGYPDKYALTNGDIEQFKALAFMGLQGSNFYKEKVVDSGKENEYNVFRGNFVGGSANICPF